MRKVTLILFLLLFGNFFCQDTLIVENKYGKYVFIKNGSLLKEKIHYQNGVISVRVIYVYDDVTLRKRIYYTKDNKVIATIFD